MTFFMDFREGLYLPAEGVKSLRNAEEVEKCGLTGLQFRINEAPSDYWPVWNSKDVTDPGYLDLKTWSTYPGFYFRCTHFPGLK